MFGGGKKKSAAPKPNRQHDLSQFGFLQMPVTPDGQLVVQENPEEDKALEAELAALMREDDVAAKPKRAAPAAPKRQHSKPVDLDAMVASCMKDYR